MGMGMALSMSSSLSSSARQASTLASFQQRQHDMAALKSAIHSGDLNAAQLAYSTLTQGTPNLNANSPLAKLGQELKAGNLTQAQQELTTWGAKPNAAAISNTIAPDSSNFNQANAIAQALRQTLGNGASNANTPTSEKTNKAMDAFMQNLMAFAAQQSNAAPQGVSQASPVTSESTVMANAYASSKAKSSNKSATHHHGAGRGKSKGSTTNASSSNTNSSPLSGVLNTLAEVTSSTNTNADSNSGSSGSVIQNENSSNAQIPSAGLNTTGASPTSSALDTLSQSFQTMVSALGGNPQSTSMSSFLSALTQNLENMPSTGNFINVTA